ncbi:MAG: NAD-dependent epimerase/dehydratase family protein [Mariprofundales bacterium]|nr:NAD-dependent epimerase/dehydratase family protein [Mariprofundales bacterium]
MHALVTGVSGFIGRRLTTLLLQNGWHVSGTSRHPVCIDGVSWHYWDLTTQPDPALFTGIDVIFHLAGKAHALSESRQHDHEYELINHGGTERLLQAAHQAGVQRIIYFSSVKAIANRANDSHADDTPYGRSKRRAEQLLLTSGLVAQPVILRPVMVYGATHKGNLPRMIRASRRGLFPPLPDTGNRRSMVHVNDVAQAALLLATHPEASNNSYIVTDGNDYSIQQIQQWIRDALNLPPARWSLPLPLLNLASTIGDTIGKISGSRLPFDSDTLDKLLGDARYSSQPLQQLGFTPAHSLQESMAEIVQFVLNDRGES